MTELSIAEMNAEVTPAGILQRFFRKRLDRNPSYSVRAFARDLGVSQTLLSLIFAGKRTLSFQQAFRFASKLGMNAEEKQTWFQKVFSALPEKAKGRHRLQALLDGEYADPNRADSPSERTELEVEYLRILPEWYHLAILDFSQVKNFKPEPEWIAERLGIQPQQVREAIERLLHIGLFKWADGKLTKTNLHIEFPSSGAQPLVREFHQQMANKAIECLRSTDPEAYRRRKMSSLTFSVRTDRLPEAFARIEKFKMEMADLLAEGVSNSLYQLNVQLFPLIQPPFEERP
jgi:uncharacterized protein (TIGR02147 family)